MNQENTQTIKDKMKKTLYILIGLNAVLLIGIILFKDLFGIFEHTFENSDPFFSVLETTDDQNKLKKIKIKQFLGGKELSDLGSSLQEESVNNWLIKGDKTPAYKADFKKVEAIFKLFPEAKRFILISSREERQEATGTTKQGETTLVEFLADSDEVIHSFYIGKATPGGAKTFARMSNESEIYSLNGNYNTVFKKDLHDWRDKSIFSFSPGKPTEYAVNVKDEKSFVLKKKKKGWKIVKPFKHPAKPKQVDRLITAMSKLQANKIIMKPKKIKKFLSKKPIGIIQAKWKGKKKPVQENLIILDAKYAEKKGKKKKKEKSRIEKYFVTNTQQAEVFTIAAAKLKSLMNDPEKLKKKKEDKKDKAKIDPALGADKMKDVPINLDDK